MAALPSRHLLAAASAALEQSWRYAWANYLCLGLLRQDLAWTRAWAVFLAGALLTAGLRGRGWRRVTNLALQACGLGLATALIVHHFHAPSLALFNTRWLLDLFGRPQPASFWVALCLEVLIVAALYYGGGRWATGDRGYERMRMRFDLGLSCLFLLYLIKFVLRARFDTVVADPQAWTGTLLFLAGGLLTLALARTPDRGFKTFQAGHQKMAIVLAVAGGIVLIATATVMVGLPLLNSAAEKGYTILGAGAKPLAPIIAVVVKFLFGPRNRAMENAPQGGSGGDSGAGAINLDTVQGASTAGAVMEGVLLGLLATVMIALAAFVLYRLCAWLLARPAGTSRAPGGGLEWYRPFADLWLKCQAIGRRWLRSLGHDLDPLRLFRCLLRWGRLSGLPRAAAETPREYGRRLTRHFPGLQPEMEAIVTVLELEVYGATHPAREELIRARDGWRRLRRPRLWPARCRTWFRGPWTFPGDASARQAAPGAGDFAKQGHFAYSGPQGHADEPDAGGPRPPL